VIYVRLIWL